MSALCALRIARGSALNCLKASSNRALVSRPRPFTWERLGGLQRRSITTPPPQTARSELTIEQYEQLSDETMDGLLDSLEELVDRLGNPAFEVEYHASSGVLTLIMGEHGTYVLNKQPPNKQIWLSSPFSGPIRYDYSLAKKDWLYSRDGRSLENLLETELKQITGEDVKLGLTSKQTL